ncbi:MAG TPA: ThiF family adenylyltransferase [Nitrospira sp.]|nr:ThiF family adenylyltransferase [Nitrospira sp.]
MEVTSAIATFVIPTALLRTIIQRLQLAPHAFVHGTLGLSRTESGWRLLARSVESMADSEWMPRRRLDRPSFEIGFAPNNVTQPEAWETVDWAIRFDYGSQGPPVCRIHLGIAEERGQFTGAFLLHNESMPLRTMHVVGAGMARFEAGKVQGSSTTLGPYEARRWSRLVGAMGGATIWRRLTDLSIAVVGVGRTGSIVAASLTRSGCHALTLIDPDRLEPHNCDAMDLVTPMDCGRFKVEVVAERLMEVNESARPLAVPESVFSRRAYEALKQADVIVCAVDAPAPRLATGALAASYLKPWLDLGTGVFREGQQAIGHSGSHGVARIQMGADIRLVLPADGCVLCWGGLDAAPQGLREWEQEAGQVDWQRQRAGSFRSLNMFAVATGLRWLEELIMGRLTESQWQRVEINERGLADWRMMSPRRDPACLLCAQIGDGDAGTGLL